MFPCFFVFNLFSKFNNSTGLIIDKSYSTLELFSEILSISINEAKSYILEKRDEFFGLVKGLPVDKQEIIFHALESFDDDLNIDNIYFLANDDIHSEILKEDMNF